MSDIIPAIQFPEAFQSYAYCISIDKARAKAFSDAFEHAGLPVPKTVQGVQLRKGKHHGCEVTGNGFNCSLTHYFLVRHAQLLGLPYVVIFEDDARPSIAAKAALPTYFARVPQDCTILKLGWTLKFGKQKPFQKSSLFQVLDAYGAHAYVVFQKFYSTYIQMFHDQASSDTKLFEHSKANCVLTTSKNLFIQHNSAEDSSVVHSAKESEFCRKCGIDLKEYVLS